MYIRRLYLRNFRNYEEVSIDFSTGVNFFSGNNAEGKSNLLEAAFFVSTGRSFRTHQTAELIQQGKSYFALEAEIVRGGISHGVAIYCDATQRRLQWDGVRYPHFAPLLGLLPHVLYAPEDIRLIDGGPIERRRFLDLHLCQSDPLYVHHHVRYYKAMKYRNRLLRMDTDRSIENWEELMATSGTYLMYGRKALTEELVPKLSAVMYSISQEKESICLRYAPTIPLSDTPETAMKDAFARERAREKWLGCTLRGPHRDEVQMEINGVSVKTFASEGQKRSCLFALRLAEWDRLYTVTDTPPLLSIDDVGVHLDPIRLNLLSVHLRARGQVFLTSPRPFPDRYFTLFRIHNQKIYPEGLSSVTTVTEEV